MLAANKLFLDVEIARDLVDTPVGQFDHGFEVIEKKELGKSGRWFIDWHIVIREPYSGAFYKSFYSLGATEMQEHDLWEWTDKAEFFRVEPKQKVVTYYTAVEN